MNEKDYLHELYSFAEICVASAEDMTWAEMGRQCGLSPQTIQKLWNKKTRYPRLLTVQKLGYGMGFKLIIEGSKFRIEVL